LPWRLNIGQEIVKQLEIGMGKVNNKMVLVVDDEPDIREFLATALNDGGFRVVTAGNGNEALEAVKRQKPDLISLDLVMPQKSGVRFYRDLIKNREWSEIPIIIVTGHARDGIGQADLMELTIEGPGVYLEKPVDARSYLKAVRQVLGLDDLS
jgi:CheY-like chemotaxis protein